MGGGERSAEQQFGENHASRILSDFGWTPIDIKDFNIPCLDKAEHKGRTHHGLDGLYKYVDPYTTEETFVIAEHKGYAGENISKSAFFNDILELGMAITCAAEGGLFNNLRTDDLQTGIIGLLTVLDHDEGYKGNFHEEVIGRIGVTLSDHLDQAALAEVDKYVGGKAVYCLGPRELRFLNDVTQDLALTFKTDNLNLRYRHIEGSGRKAPKPESRTLSAPELLAPYLCVQATHLPTPQHVLYYRHEITEKEEFVFLIEMLVGQGMLTDHRSTVTIKVPGLSKDIKALFAKAKDDYNRVILHDLGASRMEQITLSEFTSVKLRLS